MAGKQTRQEAGLPANVDAERFVLGSILLDDKSFSNVRLEGGDFSLEKHRLIWKRMCQLHEDGERIDRVTLADYLMRFGELEACDGLSYLVSLDDGMPQVNNLDSYVRLVKDRSLRRSIIFSSQNTINASMLEQEDTEVILHQAAHRLAALEAQSSTATNLLTPAQIVTAHGGPSGFLAHSVDPGIPWGYPQMDEHLLGIQPGCQYIVAGRTSSGKTALACNIAQSLAKRGVPVAILSLEMTKEILLARMICSEAKVPIRYYLKHELSAEQSKAVTEAFPKVYDLPIYIDDTPGLTITDMVQRINLAVAQHKVRVFLLDHIHRINWSGDPRMKIRDEYQGITIASWTSCLLVRQHTKAGNPLSSLILCQFNRPSDKKNAGAPPVLEDLRVSGALEQDATGIAMIHRPEQFLPGRPELRGKADLYIRKSRNGSTGKCELDFKASHTTFYDNGGSSSEEEE